MIAIRSMMKHKKAKSKKGKMHHLRVKRKGTKKFKTGGGGVRAHPRTRLVYDEQPLTARVKESLQNYKEGKTTAFHSVDEMWQAISSDND
jgi:hypothetical protein